MIKNYWDFSMETSLYVGLDELLKYIKENNIYKLNIFTNESLNSKEELNDIKVNFFDNNHGCFIKDYKYKYISKAYVDKNFFDANKDIIVETLREEIYKADHKYISKEVYEENFIKKLIVDFDTIEFAPDVELSDEIISILSENHIAAYTKENKERKEITRCYFLGQEYKNLVSKSNYLTIEDTITDYENLKLIAPHKRISIKKDGWKEIKDYDNVYRIISTIRENGQDNYIEIEIDLYDRENFKKSKLYQSDLQYNISGVELLLEYDHEEYKKQEELLDLITNDIKNSDFSPFEKYIAVYNIAKKFKDYNENEKDLGASRYFKYFMNNEYMVCVGFAKLLADLCERVGINTYSYSLKVDISYDKGFSKEEKLVDLAGHARIIVDIKDPKYNIDGYYVADPTWDNFLEYDLYNYALMSFDKTAQNKRYVNLTIEDLLMNVRSIEEYIEKINFILNRSKDDNELSSIKGKILKIIKDLYPKYYDKMNEKYGNIEKVKEPDVLHAIIMEAGYLFVDKNGKDISLETIIDAASIVNDKVFGFDEEKSKDYKDKLYKYNLERDKEAFPYYYEDGRKI